MNRRGEGDAGVEPAVVADLDDQARPRDPVAKLPALLDGRPQRLLDQDVLAGLDRLEAGRDVERVGDGDDHGVDLGVGEHRVVVAVGDRRPVDGRGALAEVVGDVADGVQLGVPGLAAGVEVDDLRDRAAAEDADPEAAVRGPSVIHEIIPG